MTKTSLLITYHKVLVDGGIPDEDITQALRIAEDFLAGRPSAWHFTGPMARKAVKLLDPNFFVTSLNLQNLPE